MLTLTLTARRIGVSAFRVGVIFCLLLVTPPAYASGGDYRFQEVAEGIHVHQGRNEEMVASNHGDIVNSSFIIGRNAVAVIDPGGSVRNGLLLLKAIRSRTPLPVRWVVLSHIHPDHVAALSVFPESVEVIAHAHYPRALAQRGEFYFSRYPSLFDRDSHKALRPPDTLVEDSLQLDLGDRRLLIEAHPTAHTDNDLTVMDSASNTLFTSDLVFAQRTPSLDGSLLGWLGVMRSLAEEDYSLVIPGHGEPGSWDEVAGPQLYYLQQLRLDVSAHIAAGDSLSESIEAGLLHENEQGWLLFERVHPGNITKAYTELEWK